MVGYFLGGVVTIGLTFLLHIAINWLFREGWISDYKYAKESKPSWIDKTNRLISEGISTILRKGQIPSRLSLSLRFNYYSIHYGDKCSKPDFCGIWMDERLTYEKAPDRYICDHPF